MSEAKSNIKIKKIIKIGGVAVFFILIFAYAFFTSRNLILGVKIKDVNMGGQPVESGATIKEEVINLYGNAKNAVNLTLNGREISVDQGGNFKETVALSSGYNIINIRAQDKFGFVDEKNYKLMHIE